MRIVIAGLIICLISVSSGYNFNISIDLDSINNNQLEDPTVEFTSQLENSVFYTHDPNEKFTTSLLLYITPSGAIDLNTVGIDYMLILDGSGSVLADGWNSTLYWAREFINNTRDIDRISVVTFATGATLQYSFSNNQTKNEVVTAVAGIPYPTGWTHTYDGVNVAINEYNTNSNTTTPKVIYMLTDGIPSSSGGSQDPCPLTSQLDILNQKFYIVGVGNSWDPSSIECLVDDPVEDIVFYEDYASLEFNLAQIIDQLTGLGNLTGTNIELSLDLNTELSFSSFSQNPDNYSTLLTTINTTKWYHDEIRIYDHFNISIEIEFNGTGSIPVYFDSSYLKYTSVSDENITVSLNELNVQILDPANTQTSPGTGSVSGTEDTNDRDYLTRLLNLDRETLQLIAAGFIVFFLLLLLLRRRRKK